MNRTASILVAAAAILPLALGPAVAAPLTRDDAKVCAAIEAGDAKAKTVDCTATGSIESASKAEREASKLYPSGPVNATNGIWF
jgi:hypothetical protein